MPRNARTAAAPAANTVATPTSAALEARIVALTAELRDREERHERIIAAVAEGIYDWDIERNALSPSPRLIEIFGFRGRELHASDWNVLVHPDDFPSYRDALRDCFRGITPRLDCEYRIRHSDGAYRWIEDRAVPVRNAAGRAIRLTGAITDISDRKVAEQGLRESLEYQTAISDVLKVISRSVVDLDAVLDAVVTSAVRLCRADQAVIYRNHDGEYRWAAGHSLAADYERIERDIRIVPGTGSLVGRAALEGRTVQIDDAWTDPLYEAKEDARVGGVRSMLGVPLLRDGAVIGVIGLARRRVEPYSEREKELVTTFADQAVIAIENTRLITETREALEQQTATAEVLQVINSSPGDLAPVFDAMLEKALRLCEAAFGVLWSFEAECFEAIALKRVPERYAEWLKGPQRFSAATAHGRVTRGEHLVHISDVASETLYRSGDPHRQALVELGGARSFLLVPLRQDGVLLGAIQVFRQEVRPFSEKQIALLQNFATQAVIAMENARLLGELRERTRDLEESLEYQTATSDVLKVISHSADDLQPVFETIVATAARLCNAQTAFISSREEDAVRIRATFAVSPEFESFIGGRRLPLSRENVAGRTALEGRVVQVPDITNDPEFKLRESITIGKLRTVLGVPLLRDGTVVGVITLGREWVEAFTERQIELVRTFADQAVIAIENARLITETREALEQQTATAEVLQVINASPGELDPVFEAMLERAGRLCEAQTSHLLRYENEAFSRIASLGVSEDFDKILPLNTPVPHIITQDSVPYRMLASRAVVHVHDLHEDESIRAGAPAETMAMATGIRTLLFVPLLKEGDVVGCFVMHRLELRPFSDKQIALLQNFAAQAVIAMENARLLGELRQRTRDLEESLEYQTATSDVLQVISRSTFDLQPVLDTLVETAARLCKADAAALAIRNADVYRYVARHAASPNPDWDARLREIEYRPGRQTIAGRVALERRTVHIADIAADPEYEIPETITVGRNRTSLGVPLLREGEPIGIITLARHRVEPFTERQIELVRTFADQAVIAIENARLLTELRESLEQQQAIAELLGVINSSPGNLAPVFDAILQHGTSLCEAGFGVLSLYRGDDVHEVVAMRSLPPELAELLRRPVFLGPETGMGRLVRGERFVHIPNAADDEGYRQGNPVRRALVDVAGTRTYLALPLRKDDALLGAFTIYRQEIRPFTDKQIALLENFAAQAVIAMDNARLLQEIRQTQAELRVTFDNMGDGVAMFDDEMRLAAWNMNFQKILDLPDEFVAQRPSLQEYFRYMSARGEYDSAGAELEAQIRRGIEDARSESRFERTRPDGRVIEVRRNAVPGGGSVLIFSDITERKRAEAEIRAARDAAESALGELKAAQAQLIHTEKMASLGQLTAGIAHEIKNPLNFVNNFATLSVELLDELNEMAGPGIATLDAGTRAEIDETVGMLTSNLDKIAEHGRRADGIVKSMLAHSRGSSGERQRVDLNALIDEALNLAYHGARAQDPGFNITLDRDYAPALPPIEVVPQDITRVFLNLIGNGFYAATKRRDQTADPAFRPVLTVSTREFGHAVEIAVRDNGIGIAPGLRDKLFQPFFTTKPTGEGTGLGLSISYDIVTQEHGGTIAVDSQVGAFTEFTVRLPRGLPAVPGRATGHA